MLIILLILYYIIQHNRYFCYFILLLLFLLFKTFMSFLPLIPIQTFLPLLFISSPVEELHRFSLALSVALCNATSANNIVDVIVAANIGKASQHLFNPLRGVGNKLICLRLLNLLDLLSLPMLLILLMQKFFFIGIRLYFATFDKRSLNSSLAFRRSLYATFFVELIVYIILIQSCCISLKSGLKLIVKICLINMVVLLIMFILAETKMI